MSDELYNYEEQAKKFEEFLSNLNRSATLPPGSYWIGDPCYFVDSSKCPEGCNWHSILAKTVSKSPGSDNDDWFGYGVFPVMNPDAKKKEGYILCASTIHGDGGYMGSDGFEYSVDAGLLGAFDADCATTSLKECEQLGTLFVAREPIEVSYNRKQITFRSGEKELSIYIGA